MVTPIYANEAKQIAVEANKARKQELLKDIFADICRASNEGHTMAFIYLRARYEIYFEIVRELEALGYKIEETQTDKHSSGQFVFYVDWE